MKSYKLLSPQLMDFYDPIDPGFGDMWYIVSCLLIKVVIVDTMVKCRIKNRVQKSTTHNYHRL